MLLSPPAEMDCRSFSKRKRSDIETEETRNQTFTLENINNASFVTFEPIAKLLRAHLPLSWLAAAASDSALSSASVLQGRIQCVLSWEYSVFVARHAPNGGLYALEKVEQDVFVVHPLQPFVHENWIHDAAVGAAPAVNMQMMLHYLPLPETSTASNLRRTPSLTSESALRIAKNRRGAAARLSILSLSEKQDTSVPPSPLFQDSPLPVEDTAVAHTPLLDSLPTLMLEQEPAAESQQQIAPKTVHDQEEPRTDMLSPAYLRQRYLEHLYLSKTSVAFYTKGPLNRARARARAEHTSITLSQLAEFYRDSVLPNKKMDVKYKESVKEVIIKATKECESQEDSTIKKKSSKKTKLGKDGLWPAEPDMIRRWWRARPLTASPSDQQDAGMRDAIAAIRMREAQMQIILIFETIAIETKQHPLAQRPVPPSSEIKAESIETEALPEDKPEKRKKRDLEADLELLVDKLCIWHSIGLEAIDTSSTGPEGRQGDEEQIDSKDRLRSFCIDVIIPFYSSKLPLLCKRVCKMLAGPEVFEQSQKSARMKQETVQPTAPGAAFRHRAPSASGRVFGRVLSEGGLRQSSPSVLVPSLVRSSTLPPVPPFKREASEVSQRPLSRQTSVSFVNREVDLEADAQMTASKRRKLDIVANQKQELAAAIQALKKPNRVTAGKTYADEVEKRAADLRKQAVQITATPRANRKRTAIDTNDCQLVQQIDQDEAVVPLSGTKPRIITSGKPPASVPSSKRNAVLAAICDTPSKGLAKQTDPLGLSNGKDTMRMKLDLPKISLHSGVTTPAREKKITEMFKTPVKKIKSTSASDEQENSFRLGNAAVQTMDRAMNMPVSDSIYDSLGWNDDYDI